jgi:hypothetical protein
MLPEDRVKILENQIQEMKKMHTEFMDKTTVLIDQLGQK